MSVTGLTQFPITVLLVDDQLIIGEAVRRTLVEEADITFHHCLDPMQAISKANELKPTVILQDLVMPDVDGLTLVKFYRANESTRDTPLIVLSTKEDPVIKAESFAVGANDYVVKLPDRLELIARIRYHSRGYIALLERNEAYAALAKSQAQLAHEIEVAVKYVQSLLPAKEKGRVTIDWRYIPCVELGGDTFGYHWIDDDQIAMYLLDVTGHGLDSALLAVSVMNVLRSPALLNANPADPGAVLGALNRAFPMEQYGEKSFTIWYGVFDTKSRTLSWSGGGHPEAFLFEGGVKGQEPIGLESPGPLMGLMDWAEFDTLRREVPSGSKLYLYSDGCHEIRLTTGPMWPTAEYIEFLSKPQTEGSKLDALHQHVREIHGSDQLDDDFSILEVTF